MTQPENKFPGAFTPEVLAQGIAPPEEQAAAVELFETVKAEVIRPAMETTAKKFEELGHSCSIEEIDTPGGPSISLTVRVAGEDYTERLQPPFLVYTLEKKSCLVRSEGSFTIPTWDSTRVMIPVGSIEPQKLTSQSVEKRIVAMMRQIDDIKNSRHEDPDVAEFIVAELKNPGGGKG